MTAYFWSHTDKVRTGKLLCERLVIKRLCGILGRTPAASEQATAHKVLNQHVGITGVGDNASLDQWLDKLEAATKSDASRWLGGKCVGYQRVEITFFPAAEAHKGGA